QRARRPPGPRARIPNPCSNDLLASAAAIRATSWASQPDLTKPFHTSDEPLVLPSMAPDNKVGNTLSAGVAGAPAGSHLQRARRRRGQCAVPQSLTQQTATSMSSAPSDDDDRTIIRPSPKPAPPPAPAADSGSGLPIGTFLGEFEITSV